MNDTYITKELDRVFTEFLKLFDDECKTILKNKAYFAGGCIYSLANFNIPNDYDIFLRDDEDLEVFKNLPFWKCQTEYALSYGKYQLITKYFGDPDDCVGQFDFKHNMFYYVPFSNEVKKVCEDFDYLTCGWLILNENRARDLEGVYLRVKKFKERGFIVPSDLKDKILKKTTRKKVKKYKRSRRTYNKNYY